MSRNRITNVPGAFGGVLGGVVTYSNDAKREFLGVNAATLAAHGAVSEPVAREMAEGARRETGADYALATTGIAGPGGGTPAETGGHRLYRAGHAARHGGLENVQRFRPAYFQGSHHPTSA